MLVAPEETEGIAACAQQDPPTAECQKKIKSWSDKVQGSFKRLLEMKPTPPVDTAELERKCSPRMERLQACANSRGADQCQTELEDAQGCELEFICPKQFAAWKKCGGDFSDFEKDVSATSGTCQSELIDVRECLVDITATPLKVLGVKAFK